MNMKWMSSLVLGVANIILVSTAQATLIDFDNVADGTVINSVYAAQGVTFNNPLGNADIYARSSSINASAPNVVSVFATGVPAFDARFGAIEAVFAAAEGKVSIDAAILRAPEGLGAPINFPKLEIYDTSNNLIAVVNWDFSVTPQPPAGGASAFQTLQYTSNVNNIGKVRFLSGQPGGSPSNFGLFDNLVFEALPNRVPEPQTGLLFIFGILGLLLYRKSKV